MTDDLRPVPDLAATLGNVFSLVRDRRRWEMHRAAGLAGRSLGSWRARTIDGVEVHITAGSDATDAMLWWRNGWHLCFVPSYEHTLPAEDERPFSTFDRVGPGQVDRAKALVLREILNMLDHAAASALISAAVLRERLGEVQL